MTILCYTRGESNGYPVFPTNYKLPTTNYHMADTEEIKKRLDIVQIVSEYFPLKKAGVTYKALCPFHSERTPSFTVSSERQSWHCFGCSEGGDVISFVQKIDGLDFGETLEKLAAKAGVELDSFKPQARAQKNDKTILYTALDAATRLYHSLLLNHPSAEEARRYLAKRGLSAEIIAQFRLGYAPNAWHTSEQLMVKQGLSEDTSWRSGLAVKREGDKGFYDRFRDRIMFPIDDVSGRIIGFTGRLLQDYEDQPKYLNTSESQVFKKSEAVYALSHARTAIRQAKAAIVVEGQMDCLTSHQFGFTNTVATSGTALNEGFLRLLKRYCDTIMFAFDADSAGLKAARAAAHLSYSLELNPLIITIPYGKDPDECIRHDADAWKKAFSRAVSAVDYFIDQALIEPGVLSAIRKKRIVQDLLPLIRSVKNAVEQAEYIKHLAEKLRTTEQSLYADLKHATAPSPLHNAEAEPQKPSLGELDLERQLIGLIFAYFDLLPHLTQIHFENEALASIYQTSREAQDRKEDTAWILERVPKDWQDKISQLTAETMRRHEQLDNEAIKTEIEDLIKRIEDANRESRVITNARAIAAAFSKGNVGEARQLLKSLDSDTVTKD